MGRYASVLLWAEMDAPHLRCAGVCMLARLERMCAIVLRVGEKRQGQMCVLRFLIWNKLHYSESRSIYHAFLSLNS